MATNTSGTTFAPSALDPYQIETELAKTAYNQPQQQTLMDQYWFERQANKNLYGQEIGLNRELQQQQMQNALQQEMIKQYHNAAQDPGVAEALQGSGAGFAPQVLSLLQQSAAEKAKAENLSKYGSAASGLSTAGMGADALTANTGLQGFGVRPDIQIADMNNAARLAAARIHAASGGGAAGPSESVSSAPDPALGYATHNYSFPGKLGWSPEKKEEFLKGTGKFGPRGGPPPPSQAAPPSASTGGGTNLPVAKKDTPAPSTATPAAAAAYKPSSAEVNTVKQRLPSAPPDVRRDVEAAMQGNKGEPIIVKKPDGSKGVKGASGKVY